MRENNIKIIISGGGSGGHVFPAIAIANALKNNIENVEILFIGAKGKMEMEKVPEAGFKIIGLWISGLQRKLTIKNLMFPFKVILSLMKAKKIIKNFKPDVVVGVGGYASGPTLRVASKMKIPTLIQEQNSYPGITNKLLSKSVNKICVAYNGMEKYFPKEKIYITGNPVRKEVIKLQGKKDRAMEHFNLSNEKKILLVIGGSLGARTINESIHKNLKLFKENNLQLIWQTGKYYIDIAKDAVKNYADDGINAYEFIKKMDLAYAAADIVVSRAGAIAISELCAVKKPCILIPSPNVAEDHQTKNAMTLFNYNAAILVKDIEAKDKLGKVIIELLNDEQQQHQLIEKIWSLAFKDPAKTIADVILSLIKK